MSVGNQTQAIDFDKGMLTLVLGENLDLGGDDSGARNGTGKTTIINSLSYAIYGVALTNIKRDNLVNKINSKGMLVTIDFEKNGVAYHIERGRKPNVLKLSVDGTEYQEDDDEVLITGLCAVATMPSGIIDWQQRKFYLNNMSCIRVYKEIRYTEMLDSKAWS